jgi:hypothetical protein
MPVLFDVEPSTYATLKGSIDDERYREVEWSVQYAEVSQILNTWLTFLIMWEYIDKNDITHDVVANDRSGYDSTGVIDIMVAQFPAADGEK